ncbi:MAG: class I SAM-dependent methyltransferase family protein, partial [Candidatus Micrarchaeota archaeon]
LCIKISKEKANAVHKFLIEKNFLDKNYKPMRKGKFVLFPIKKEGKKEIKKLIKNANVSFANLQKRNLPSRPSLPFSSFDIMGEIAVLEIPLHLQKREKEIANLILTGNKNIKTVAKKIEGTGGKYRIRPVETIAGKKITKTICGESGCKFLIDINKAYYTPRFGSERLRIAKLVKEGENILVLFAGICPYPVVIEKNAKENVEKIIAIELNPHAHKFALQNIKLNKCKKIIAVKGDAEKELKKKKYKNWADRVIMPHPSESLKFLPLALNSAKNNGLIHLYAFDYAGANAKNIFKEAEKIAKKQNIIVELVRWKAVRPYSPSLEQVVVDLRVRKKQ